MARLRRFTLRAPPILAILQNLGEKRDLAISLETFALIALH